MVFVVLVVLLATFWWSISSLLSSSTSLWWSSVPVVFTVWSAVVIVIVVIVVVVPWWVACRLVDRSFSDWWWGWCPVSGVDSAWVSVPHGVDRPSGTCVNGLLASSLGRDACRLSRGRYHPRFFIGVRVVSVTACSALLGGFPISTSLWVVEGRVLISLLLRFSLVLGPAFGGPVRGAFVRSSSVFPGVGLGYGVILCLSCLFGSVRSGAMPLDTEGLPHFPFCGPSYLSQVGLRLQVRAPAPFVSLRAWHRVDSDRRYGHWVLSSLLLGE